MRATARPPLSLSNRPVLLVLIWTVLPRLTIIRRPVDSLLCPVLPLRQALLLLLGLLRLTPQPVGGRSRTPADTRATLIVAREATAELLSAGVEATPSHLLIARKAPASATCESASESPRTVASACSRELMVLLIGEGASCWSGHHHLRRMLQRSLIVAGMVVAAALAVRVVAVEP